MNLQVRLKLIKEERVDAKCSSRKSVKFLKLSNNTPILYACTDIYKLFKKAAGLSLILKV